MFSFRKGRIALAGAALVALASAWAAPAQQGSAARFDGISRPATPAEVRAWDIDVRPDFKGLPPGSGSVSKGQDIWEARCASCHGVFGESNQTFSPLIGGTTKEDIKTGRVANLLRTDYPARTTLMKVATVSTLWDYINRAMPWNEPKSLSADEVYAVTAFLLNLADVVPEDYTLSEKNIAEVQARLPNRNGMTTEHALWPGREFGNFKPDTGNKACQSNCAAASPKLATLPDFARNAHGNLAQQNRLVGAQHGADTSRPEGKRLGDTAVQIAATASSSMQVQEQPVVALLQKHACTACHAMDSKLIGPAFAEIAKKHAGKSDYLVEKIRQGGVGVWGSIPMPAQTLDEADAKNIAEWLAAGAAH